MSPPRALLPGGLTATQGGSVVARCPKSAVWNGAVRVRRAWSRSALCWRPHRCCRPPVAAIAPIHTVLEAEPGEPDQEEDVGMPEVVNAVPNDGFPGLLDNHAEQAPVNGSAEPDVVHVEATDEVDDSLKIENLNLSEETVRALSAKGIDALFPIQKHVFDPVMQGRDLIGRAKTGSGKTLAFALPVVESLLQENREQPPARGRSPRCLVMCPTRELANQVAREFGSAAPSLSMGSFYGGVSIFNQKRQLSNGMDVVVGTPGRLLDLIEQGAMDLSQIRFSILDESDQMLDMGFEEDMEKILRYTPTQRQTMLFSATLPGWVKKVSRKYLNNHLLVDLVGDHATGRIAESIKSLGIMIDRRARREVLLDLLVVHSAGERAIVFTQTKREADFVASHITTTLPCEALHGDIPQQQRELTLNRFRDGRFSVLVATDVAARGLDIPNVDLVVHYDVPQDSESFLHRSGRTGRAGNTGTTIVMFTKPEARDVNRRMKETHTKMQMIGPPAPRDVMKASTKSVLSRMNTVEPDVVKFFAPAAMKLLSAGNGEEVLAAALASMSGFNKVPKPRSLLTQQEGFVSLRILSKHGRIQSKGHILGIVRELVGDHATSRVGRMEMYFDDEAHKEGAIVDMPVDDAIVFLQTAAQNPDGKACRGLVIDRPKHLPMSLCLSGSGRSDRQTNGYPGRGGRRFNGRGNGYFDRRSGYGGSGDGRYYRKGRSSRSEYSPRGAPSGRGRGGGSWYRASRDGRRRDGYSRGRDRGDWS